MSQQTTAIEQEIIKLTHEWMDAVGRRDRQALERILGDDFMIAGWLPEGRLADKPFYINDCLMSVGLEQARYSYDRWHFQTYPNTAVVHCILDCHALVAGKEWGGVFLNTYVWINRDNSWQVVSCHSSAVLNP
jgi:hypothetical protein